MAVTAATNAMITTTEVKRWLGLTTTDADDFLQDAINNWSDTIETRCNRKIKSASFTSERHDGGKIAIIPRNIPVTAVTSIIIDGYTLSPDDYTLDREGATIRMKSGLAFDGGPGSILLSYTGGYAAVPGDLKRAMNQLVALEYYLSGAGGRKALAKRGESAQGGSVTYERSPQDQERILEGIVKRYGRR